MSVVVAAKMAFDLAILGFVMKVSGGANLPLIQSTN